MARMKRARRSRGAPPKNAARAHYDHLMKQGTGNSEACRIVGISRNPGTRWRHGHTVVTKTGTSSTLRSPDSGHLWSPRLLSKTERTTIADLLHARRSVRAIATELGRSPSTVSREIRRESTRSPHGNYEHPPGPPPAFPDLGPEMACHQDFTRRTLIPVYFCDPASPWQRGSNENTGLLRQYFPKGTDLAIRSPEHLATVAA